jgi:hypothetical protein
METSREREREREREGGGGRGQVLLRLHVPSVHEVSRMSMRIMLRFLPHS